MCVYACVCVCERERECVCVCVCVSLMHPYRAGELTTGNAIPHTHSPVLFSFNDYERLMPCSLSLARSLALSLLHTHMYV